MFGLPVAIVIFKHPSIPGTLTIAGKPSDDLHPKTWKSILNTINSDREES
jgi:predicted RNA binding protein YcfA (HicA-like mRNA interferase family)